MCIESKTETGRDMFNQERSSWEDPLEKEMATQSNILAWEIPWTEEPGGLKCLEITKSYT